MIDEPMSRRTRTPIAVALSGKACQGDEAGDFRPLIRKAELPTVSPHWADA